MSAEATIAILTDFGLSDAYVGQMKGVIRAIAPQARVIDLTHLVPPQSVTLGAIYLQQSAPYFPEDTIFLAVVDPGVGTDRRSLAAHSGGRFFVGPDNGLLSLALNEQATIHALENPRLMNPHVSATFHGRDVFAPAAAHLANGVALSEFGASVSDPATLAWPEPIPQERGAWKVPIVAADHFGNLVTALKPGDMLRLGVREAAFYVGDRQIGTISPTFGAVPGGQWLAYWGSSDLLEIAINGGNASLSSGISGGDFILMKDLSVADASPGSGGEWR